MTLVALGASGAAWSQERPWTVGVSQTVRYDSNVFRTPRGTPADSDIESITGLDGRLRARLSRQEAYVAAGAGLHRYRDNDSLDHVSGRFETGINWSTVERLSGTVRYAQSRSLAAFGTAGAQVITERAIERAELADATVRYGIGSRSALQAGWAHRRVDYSITEFEDQEYRQTVTSLGFLHGLERPLTLGVGVRYTRGRTPRYDEPAPGVFVADRSTRRDLDFTATWVPSGLSTINARLSASEEDHSQAEEADFSGLTGSLSWDYQPSGRLSFNTLLERDTGSESRFSRFTADSPETSVESRRIVTSAQVGARYALTGKINLHARLREARTSLRDTAGSSGRENATAYVVGIDYRPARAWLVACEAGQEKRSTGSALSYSYQATVAQCLVRLSLD